MGLSIDPPAGVPEPEVTESIGGTTTVNSDTHVRVWVAQIPEAGTYEITTDGNVNGYINPRLAFGHASSHSWLLWLFGGLFVMGLLELFAALFWSARIGKKARPLGPQELLTFDRADVERGPSTYTARGELCAHRPGHPIGAAQDTGRAAGFGSADRRGVRGREAPHPRDLNCRDRACLSGDTPRNYPSLRTLTAPECQVSKRRRAAWI